MGLTHEFLTNIVERSPWWKANISSASQDIPKIAWIPNVHYPVHKSQLRVRTMNQLNSGQSTHTDLYKIHFNIKLPSIPTSSKVPISCRRTHHNLFSPPIPVRALPQSRYPSLHITYFSVRREWQDFHGPLNSSFEVPRFSYRNTEGQSINTQG